MTLGACAAACSAVSCWTKRVLYTVQYTAHSIDMLTQPVCSGVYYAFASDASRNDWGYRFTVRALRPPPLTPDAHARLAVACAAVDAALRNEARAPVLSARGWLEALAVACAAADGARRRGLLGCLARVAGRAEEVPDADLPDDEVFRPVVEALVRAVHTGRAAGEAMGTADVLALALAVSAWCVRAHRPPHPPHRTLFRYLVRARASSTRAARMEAADAWVQ